MGQTATTIVIIACLIVLAVLVFGFSSFARGGEFHARHSNRIMQVRVIAQFCAVILIVFLAWVARGGQ
jgi:hypothetical protein